MASVPDRCSESRVGAARNSQDLRLPFPCEVSAIHELATLELWVRQCTADALAGSHGSASSHLCHPSFGTLDYTRTTSNLPHVHVPKIPFVCIKGCLSVDCCNCWGCTPAAVASAIQTRMHHQKKRSIRVTCHTLWPLYKVLQPQQHVARCFTSELLSVQSMFPPEYAGLEGHQMQVSGSLSVAHIEFSGTGTAFHVYPHHHAIPPYQSKATTEHIPGLAHQSTGYSTAPVLESHTSHGQNS